VPHLLLCHMSSQLYTFSNTFVKNCSYAIQVVCFISKMTLLASGITTNPLEFFQDNALLNIFYLSQCLSLSFYYIYSSRPSLFSNSKMISRWIDSLKFGVSCSYCGRNCDISSCSCCNIQYGASLCRLRMRYAHPFCSQYIKYTRNCSHA
jgi:hypothetical protein